ncbi:MAG TPA: pyridoxal-dependent decarboxylase, exosortase A system-associated [Woeseiaceae bacterium]|nr:pyridoxal-dependent decarboxylase, exosortase A system-associated [Woeseiaceae bacterium]
MSEPQTKTHAATESLSYEDNELLWGGRKVSELALTAGQTPFYAYDRARMASRVRELREALPAELHIHYAMKANPMPEVVDFLAGLVDGLDVASVGEMEIALQTGTNASDISFAGPGKRDEELKSAIAAGITINIESIGELRRIAGLAADAGKRPDVAIRVNPAFELKTAGMKMGGRPSPFGIDAEVVPAVLRELAGLDLNFRGFHVFSGSQNLRAEAIIEAITKTAELVIELAESTPLRPALINIGGGLGVPYFPGERSLVLGSIGEAAAKAVGRLKSALGNVEVVTELGRYLVGQSGIYVTRVIDVKESRGAKFAVCDGGLHHHLAASGNFGQVIRKNYPVVSVDSTGRQEEVSVVGPLCTPLDLLGDRVTVHELRVGSLVAVLQSGAYGKTASPASFLSHPPCAEILC